MLNKKLICTLIGGLSIFASLKNIRAEDGYNSQINNISYEDSEAKWNPIQFLFWDNCENKDVYGLRLLAVHKAKKVTGVDIVSFSEAEEAYGIQCGIVSHISGNGKGIQVSLGNNYTNYSGLQAAAVNMTVDKGSLSRASGVQAAIINVANFLDGVQVGLWNSANWGGAQIGLINTGDATKLQIGLLCVNKNSSLFPVLPIVNVSNGEEKNQTKPSWF
ncbi:hypothetical protein AAEX28_14565 [Lentisphaerota bacterium WC36G]|nr:hypothetical protein LJT99_01320 [Lentisphaerae bacterium WC36]